MNGGRDQAAPGGAGHRQSAERRVDPLGHGPSMTMRGAPVTLAVILLCCAIEIAIMLNLASRDALVAGYAFLIGYDGAVVAPSLDMTLLTHAALHGGLLHIGFNMAALAAFGPPPERSMGSPAYLATFLAAAIAGALAHFGWVYALEAAGFPPPRGVMPLVGASGAISGVLALEFYRRYLFLRMARSRFADGPSPIGYLTKMSLLFVGLNLAISILPGFISGQAHIGGYLAGLALAPLFMRRPRP
ncbi:MAG: rhomboid family intramembrane serine protease [Pseudomonadota bacterium]